MKDSSSSQYVVSGALNAAGDRLYFHSSPTPLTSSSTWSSTYINGSDQRKRSLSTKMADEIFYNEIKAGSFTYYRPLSLCRLLQNSAGAGIYEVVELRGTEETVPTSATPKLESVTYAKLKRQHPWSVDAPEEAMVRLEGGPVFDENVTAMWEVSLKIGEHVGLILKEPTFRSRVNGRYAHLDGSARHFQAA